MDRSGGDPEDIQVPCMASLEGLKWTSILVLFGRTSCVSFTKSTRRPLNVPFGRPQVRHGRSIDVHWTSTGPLGITSLSKLYLRFRRFITLVQTKKWFLWTMETAQAAENHGDRWGLTWCLRWGIYTSIATWTHSHNSLAAAKALSLRIYSHGLSLKLSQRPSQSGRE